MRSYRISLRVPASLPVPPPPGRPPLRRRCVLLWRAGERTSSTYRTQERTASPHTGALTHLSLQHHVAIHICCHGVALASCTLVCALSFSAPAHQQGQAGVRGEKKCCACGPGTASVGSVVPAYRHAPHPGTGLSPPARPLEPGEGEPPRSHYAIVHLLAVDAGEQHRLLFAPASQPITHAVRHVLVLA
jgi:hypothetical protein